MKKRFACAQQPMRGVLGEAVYLLWPKRRIWLEIPFTLVFENLRRPEPEGDGPFPLRTEFVEKAGAVRD